MRRHPPRALLAALLLAACGSVSRTPAPPEPSSATLVVMGTTDLHGWIRELLIEEIARMGTLRPEDVFRQSWEIVPTALADRAAEEMRTSGQR